MGGFNVALFYAISLIVPNFSIFTLVHVSLVTISAAILMGPTCSALGSTPPKSSCCCLPVRGGRVHRRLGAGLREEMQHPSPGGKWLRPFYEVAMPRGSKERAGTPLTAGRVRE